MKKIQKKHQEILMQMLDKIYRSYLSKAIKEGLKRKKRNATKNN
jgi:hypothetical protein